jgi:hypothetical protein
MEKENYRPYMLSDDDEQTNVVHRGEDLIREIKGRCLEP